MKYIITFFPYFKKQALREVCANDEAARTVELKSGIALVDTAFGEDFGKNLVASKPIFIRHIMPVHAEHPLRNDQEDIGRILETVKMVATLTTGQPFSVQCRIIDGKTEVSSKDVEVAVGTYMETQGAVPCFSDQQLMNMDIHVISILLHTETYYVGFSKASMNLSSHSNEYRLLSRGGREISRAENKLKEAINAFGIHITGQGQALDMGASPGGWSKVLADYGFHVTAVDPGDLHPSLQQHPHIVHIKNRVENVTFSQPFEIIVNDMNVDPQITSKIMCDLAHLLAENGIAVVTLKLPFSDVDRSIRESLDVLEQRYEVRQLKNLCHNRQEITAYLIRK